MPTTYDQALDKAIEAVRPGLRYREIGDIISQYVGAHKFQVVRSYCGHGIGDLFHCAPNIPHYSHNKVRSPVSAWEGHISKIVFLGNSVALVSRVIYTFVIEEKE